MCGPIIRMVPMDRGRAAEEIMWRAGLKTLWESFKGQNSEAQFDDVLNGIMEIHPPYKKGKKENFGLIMAAANELLSERPWNTIPALTIVLHSPEFGRLNDICDA